MKIPVILKNINVDYYFWICIHVHFSLKDEIFSTYKCHLYDVDNFGVWSNITQYNLRHWVIDKINKTLPGGEQSQI
jgi:hypothetical protein